MKCQFGICLTCEKNLVKVCESCGSKRPNEHYTEIFLKWSNGAAMKTAVCKECAAKGVADTADKMEMTHAIWDAWDREGGKYLKEIVIV